MIPGSCRIIGESLHELWSASDERQHNSGEHKAEQGKGYLRQTQPSRNRPTS